MAKINNTPSNSDWVQWRKHVLLELERLNEAQSKMQLEVIKIGKEIAVLKFKSGLWGAVAGAIPAMATVLFLVITRGG